MMYRFLIPFALAAVAIAEGLPVPNLEREPYSIPDDVTIGWRMEAQFREFARNRRIEFELAHIRPLFAYNGCVSSYSCSVSFTDSDRVTHSVEVAASSLFEAVVLALVEFQRHGLVDATPSTTATLKVEVKSPVKVHEINVRKVMNWLETHGRSPAEQALKVRLREMLPAQDDSGSPGNGNRPHHTR